MNSNKQQIKLIDGIANKMKSLIPLQSRPYFKYRLENMVKELEGMKKRILTDMELENK